MQIYMICLDSDRQIYIPPVSTFPQCHGFNHVAKIRETTHTPFPSFKFANLSGVCRSRTRMTCFGKAVIGDEENKSPPQFDHSLPENPESINASVPTLNGMPPPDTVNADGPREGGLAAWLAGKSLRLCASPTNN